MSCSSGGKVDNLSRKIIHILSAIIICFFPYFLNLTQIIAISLLFSVIFIFSRYWGFLPIINRVKRKSWGEVFYPLGVMLSAIAFLGKGEVLAFQFGVIVLGFSDSAASIIGSLYGRYRINFLKGSKSVEGALAFFLTTLLILGVLLLAGTGEQSFDAGNYLLISLILTSLELVLFFGLDNLFVPLWASYLFLLLA